MLFSRCEALCEECCQAVADRFSAGLCLCAACHASTRPSRSSQPLNGSLLALRLCERCEKAPVGTTEMTCPGCATRGRRGWEDGGGGGSSEGTAGTAREGDSGDCRVPDLGEWALGGGVGWETGGAPETEERERQSKGVGVPTAVRLPSWFHLMCADLKTREQRPTRKRRRRRSTARLALASTKPDSAAQVPDQDAAATVMVEAAAGGTGTERVRVADSDGAPG
ncbi:hypothetical protein CDCA_CDCA02G0792 [Cyanidium caldarium]|uniref:B box-type domain-containing protein n=1 Tax=Cyanidium caldarium TaxID=2771 RepID=A0AAV9IR43_CYACA|nr:hypothetical protein CDCA_CDCA02G0792 [Cyanidium caldarium]